MAHFLYEYAPIIDEHNKQRHSLLALEKIWKLKDPWFRQITTSLVMTTVDMHWIYWYRRLNIKKRPFREVDSIGIVKFTDLICGDLHQWKYTYKNQKEVQTVGDTVLLTRITDKDGNTVRAPTEKHVTKGEAVGNPVVLMCYICHRYLHNGMPKQAGGVRRVTCHCVRHLKMLKARFANSLVLMSTYSLMTNTWDAKAIIPKVLRFLNIDMSL